MKTLLKIGGIVLGAIVVLALVTVIGIYFASESVLNKTYSVPTPNIAAKTDPASLERGKRIATVLSVCTDCHGPNLGGDVFIDDPALGRIIAPNLTRGKNGVGAQFSDADFARVLRYGVLPDGKSVRVMPADDYSHMSDADLSAIISYIRSVPAADSTLPTTEMRLLGRFLLATNQLPIMIADRIDVNMARGAMPAMGVSLEYGQYLANISGCTGCHGPGLSGGKIPGAPPDFPPALNLTPGGAPGSWGEADFIKTIRTGVDPAGHQLVDEMPWKTYGKMTDDELKAIWMFVKSVPAKPFGNR
jgi:mono/diheme cytochrome c family protein